MSVHTMDELLAMPIKGVPSYVGEGVLPKRGRMLVGGQPAIGKSIVVMNMAYSLAAGKPDLFGLQYTNTLHPKLKIHAPAKVLYVEQEVGLEGWKERLEAIHGKLNLPLAGTNLSLECMNFDLRLDDPRANNHWQQILGDTKPHVLVLDPFSQFHSANENDASLMNQVLMNVNKIVTAYDLSVILVHHFHKPTEIGNFGMHRFRGSSAIFAWADTRLEIDADDHETNWGHLSLSWTIRRGKPHKKMYVKIDETTLVVEPDVGALTQLPQQQPNLIGKVKGGTR